MNENLIKHISDHNISLYSLSQLSGVPYTTISKLMHGKLDINKCASETVQRIAVVLNITSDQLLNPICYIDGYKGKCKGYKYKWKFNQETGDVELLIFKKEEAAIIPIEEKCTLPEIQKYQSNIAEILIKKYIKKKELDEFTLKVGKDYA